jgi:ABC-type Fe3+/spermidine/putrescine transport system ATPase subunit
MFEITSSLMATVIIISSALAILLLAFYLKPKNNKNIFEIKLPKSDFNSGEIINGKVLIRKTKNLEIEKVYITMTGHEMTKISDTDGNMQTHMQEYFRTKNDLVDTKDSRIIKDKEIEFNLLAPRSQKSTDEWKIEVHTDSQKVKSTSSVLIKINNI